MWFRVKKILARFLPVPARTFHAKMQEMTERYNQDINDIKHILSKLNKTTDDLQKRIRLLCMLA